jgi:hypothetical protein
MELLESLLLDSLNGFSPKFIPLMILQLLVAGFLALIIEKVVNRKLKEDLLSKSALIAVVVCFMADVSKVSVAFSVLMAALLIAFVISLKIHSSSKLIGLFMVIAIALACGIGSLVQAVLTTVIILSVFYFTPLKEE